jgi:23S rRNA (guanine745-N1)-methyltransferase
VGDSAALPLECPVCRRPLDNTGRAWACAAGHSFDAAREGYVNLFPPQHRTRGIEGDTAEMLRARRRFLESGHFRPLRDLLAEKVAAILDRPASAVSPQSRHVLEVGCGEGYYVGGIAEVLGEAHGDVHLLGMDVSKAAARMAAKRYPGATFFVGDLNNRIYLQDGSVDVLLDVFAPRNPAEFARVLRPGGFLLVAIPAETHLASLRSQYRLLDIQPDKEAKVLDRLGTAFRLVGRAELCYEMTLAEGEVADVVTMGPSQWHHRGPEGGEGLALLATEASFVVLTLAPS